MDSLTTDLHLVSRILAPNFPDNPLPDIEAADHYGKAYGYCYYPSNYHRYGLITIDPDCIQSAPHWLDLRLEQVIAHELTHSHQHFRYRHRPSKPLKDYVAWAAQPSEREAEELSNRLLGSANSREHWRIIKLWIRRRYWPKVPTEPRFQVFVPAIDFSRPTCYTKAEA